MIPETKECGRCKIVKHYTEYHVRKDKGRCVKLRVNCRDCMREIARIRYSNNSEVIIKRNSDYVSRNKEKVKEWYSKWRKDNELKLKKYRLKRYRENAEVVKAERKVYYRKNKENIILAYNKYLEKNKNKVRKTQRLNHAKRKKADISYVLIKGLRARVSAAIKRGGKKCNTTTELVGCTMSELTAHLEKQFTDGMTWDNYSFMGWHIDHIIPCASFDMSDIEEQKKCFHYTNLQPLWAKDNLKKGAKIVFNNNLK